MSHIEQRQPVQGIMGVNLIVTHNQNTVYPQKGVCTFVVCKLLKTVVDNSGPKTETYEADRPLTLQIQTKREKMHNSEVAFILLVFTECKKVVRYLLSASQNLCQVFPHFS